VPESLLLGLSAVVMLGVGAQWLGWKLRLPSILLLLLFGFLAGPEVAGWIDPDALFGDLLLPVVSLSVALLLFEGGLTLRWGEIEQQSRVVLRLVTIGALVSWLLATVAAHFIADITWKPAVLLGAILVVTGPTVVGPLLRQIRPTGAVGPILKWEGILIDPVGAVLAVLVLEGILAGTAGGAAIGAFQGIFVTLLAGGGIGLAAGWLLTLMLRRYWVPDHLHSPVALALAIAAFVAGNAAHHEAGLLSVTLMGVYLGNQRRVEIGHIIEFKETVQVLLIATLFILMTARIRLADLQQLGFGAIGLVLVLLFVVRPASVLACTFGSSLKRNEKIFLSFMAPRGIVAAAIASVFALRLEQTGIEGADAIVPHAFLVIVCTVTIYGLGGAPLARRLGLASAKPQGVLMLGAHEWARDLAMTLHNLGIRVLLVDTNVNNIRTARMAGLPVLHGSLMSEATDERIDLQGIGRLFALTQNDEVNTLSGLHYRHLFGRAEIYQLGPRKESRSSAPEAQRGRALFGEDCGFTALSRRANGGARTRATLLTEQFDFDAWRERNGEAALPLITVDTEKRITVATAKTPLEPKPGVTLVALVREADSEQPG